MEGLAEWLTGQADTLDVTVLGANPPQTTLSTLRRWASEVEALRQRPGASDFRNCEFCGCHTNAVTRACCDKGRDADRQRPGAQAASEPGYSFGPSAGGKAADEMMARHAPAGERPAQAEPMTQPRFEHTYCSQCGGEFGAGNEGFSHCRDHAAQAEFTEDEIHAREWWCPHCREAVPPEMVNKDATHYLESGGCGHSVRGELIARERPGAQAPSTDSLQIVGYGYENSRPTEQQPMMLLKHSNKGDQYPELAVPLVRLADVQALLAAPSTGALYVECRECSDCGHAGLNDTGATDRCSSCERSGPSPREDKCPGCGAEGTMCSACPKCGGRYTLVADATLAAPSTGGAETAARKYDDVLLPFLSLMRRELHANSGKGDRPGWLSMDANTALLEVYWHAAKLSAAVKNNDGPAIQEHCADVANMAMMVLDVCGGLVCVEPEAASSAPAQAVETAGVREALTQLVELIDAAGLANLSSGVQLGATVWYVKASDALDYARAALQSPAASPASKEPRYLCIECGAQPSTEEHNRPDGAPCDFIPVRLREVGSGRPAPSAGQTLPAETSETQQ